MRKTKEQIINELQGELLDLKAKYKKSENMFYEIKRLLFGDSYKHEFKDIYPAVVSLIEYKQEHEASIDVHISVLERQNEKFWCLIRSLSGDKTLEKEIEMERKNVEIRQGRNNNRREWIG